MIWLLRHGDAEHETEDDFQRKLTEKGERQSRTAGRALKQLGVNPDICLTSPKVRARDTAEIACKELGADVEETDELAGGDFDPLELGAGRGDVLLIGHEPDFSRAIAAATGSRVKMRKGGVAAIDENLLHALYRPKDLKTIAS